MVSILADPSTDEQERAMAVGTIAECLFPTTKCEFIGDAYDESHKICKFDAVEVHPVHLVAEDGEVVPVMYANKVANAVEEQCNEGDPEIYKWCVYLHKVQGHVQCIADCPTEEIADTIAEIFKLNLARFQSIQ